MDETDRQSNLSELHRRLVEVGRRECGMQELEAGSEEDREKLPRIDQAAIRAGMEVLEPYCDAQGRVSGTIDPWAERWSGTGIDSVWLKARAAGKFAARKELEEVERERSALSLPRIPFEMSDRTQKPKKLTARDFRSRVFLKNVYVNYYDVEGGPKGGFVTGVGNPDFTLRQIRGGQYRLTLSAEQLHLRDGAIFYDATEDCCFQTKPVGKTAIEAARLIPRSAGIRAYCEWMEFCRGVAAREAKFYRPSGVGREENVPGLKAGENRSLFDLMLRDVEGRYDRAQWEQSEMYYEIKNQLAWRYVGERVLANVGFDDPTVQAVGKEMEEFLYPVLHYWASTGMEIKDNEVMGGGALCDAWTECQVRGRWIAFREVIGIDHEEAELAAENELRQRGIEPAYEQAPIEIGVQPDTPAVLGIGEADYGMGLTHLDDAGQELER